MQKSKLPKPPIESAQKQRALKHLGRRGVEGGKAIGAKEARRQRPPENRLAHTGVTAMYGAFTNGDVD